MNRDCRALINQGYDKRMDSHSPIRSRTGFMGMTDKMGTIHRAPTLGKMRKDKGVITPTLILPLKGEEK